MVLIVRQSVSLSLIETFFNFLFGVGVGIGIGIEGRVKLLVKMAWNAAAKALDWKVILDAEIGRELLKKAFYHKERTEHKERKKSINLCVLCVLCG